ncbi:MAG TPA: hypothetical protein VHH34_08535 [Pseudonocardiaceae bacterium]|nr:hypothetical protein [Pseudonocardiaceae bacterium]
MSRHLWNARGAKAGDPSRRRPEQQHLGIFAATVRAMKGLATRPATEPSPHPSEVDLPVPRPAPEEDEPSLPTAVITEAITEEIPRYVEPEPAEPALAMLSRGRHGMTW